MQLPTTRITKGGEFSIVNTADVAEYVKQGWKIEDAAPAPSAAAPAPEPPAPAPPEPADAPAATQTSESDAAPKSDGFDDMTVAELRVIAEDLSIDHKGLKKADLVAAIRAMRDGGSQ